MRTRNTQSVRVGTVGVVARGTDRRIERAATAALERLEDRRLFSTVVVNTVSDTATGPGVVTFDDAIAAADASTGGTTITFDPTVFAKPQTIDRGSSNAGSNVYEDTSIVGPSAGVTLTGSIGFTLLRNGGIGVNFAMSNVTVAGVQDGASFDASQNSGSLSLTDCSIIGGSSTGIISGASNTLTLTDCTVSHNGTPASNSIFGIESQGTATISGTTISGTQGGSGIFTSGNLTVTNSTISDNAGGNYSGGLVFAGGMATLTDDTISGNSTVGNYGGGIRNETSDGTLTLTNVTIVDNTAAANGGGIFNQGTTAFNNVTLSGNTTESGTGGGGVYDQAGSSQLTIANSVIAGNTAPNGGVGPDVYGPFTSEGHNLIGIVTSDATGFTSSDFAGTTASPLNPKLAGLTNNGGPTETLLPQTGSPLIDKGSNSLIPSGVTTDQRGLARIVNGTVDIGAVEVQAVAATITATAPAAQSATAGTAHTFALGSFAETGATGPYTVSVNWGDGTAATTFTAAAAGTIAPQSHTYAKAGSDTASVTVTDSAKHTSNAATFALTVSPAVVTTSLTVTPPANQTATAGAAQSFNLGSFTAANATAPYTVTVNWGDGTANTTFTAAAAGTIAAQSHTYAKAGTDTVSVTVADAAKHTSNTATFTATVSAVATPSLVVTPPANQSAMAGAAQSFALGRFAQANATGPYTVTVNWGDGTANTTFTAAAAGTIAAQSHTFAKAATDTVSVTVTDSAKHASNTATFAVAVAAVVPVTTLTVTPAANQSATAGTAESFAVGSFTETAATAPYTVDVSWGDGSADTTFTATAAGALAAQSHTYAKAGTDTVSVTVTDAAKHASNKGTFAVTVAPVTPPPPTATVGGGVDRDLTGNGLTADDTPLGGVTVRLYADANGNGTLDGSDKLLATMTSGGTTGAYSFASLAAGKYLVAESVPAGYVRTAPATTDYYAMTLTAGQKATGPTFDDFLKPTTTGVGGVAYRVDGSIVPDLRNHTAAGDTVSVTFTVTNPSGEELSLVSYTAPGATFSAATAAQQRVAQSATGFYKPGTYTLTVKVPASSHYQVDFVEGYTLTQLGPVGSNLFYTQQGRLISADNE